MEYGTFSEPLNMSPTMSEAHPAQASQPTAMDTSERLASLTGPVALDLRTRTSGSRASRGSRSMSHSTWLADGLFDKLETSCSTELTVFEAADLATRFNLPSGQVTQAWKIFKRYDTNDRGILTDSEFQLPIRHILRERHPRAKDAPRELFERAADKGRAASFVDLLTWMSVNAFSEHMLLSEEQKFIREIARKHKADVPVVEGIKRHFDTFDADGSGRIEYGEFGGLLRVLLKIKDGAALPESRVLAFWRELDDDGSGIVDFKEFIPWYLSYFAGNVETSPLEEYYRNIRQVPFPWTACTK